MGCATGLVKSVMFIFNFLFVLAGLALIGLGALFYLELNTYERVIDAQFQIAPTLVLIVGVIVFVIAFFGCCGVCRESYCMLVTYAVLLLTIFAIQLAIGVYAYLQVNEDGDVQPFMEKSLYKVFNDNNKESKEFMDLIQKEFKCCGVTGVTDYFRGVVILPPSCCGIEDKACLISNALKTGCASKLAEGFGAAMEMISYVAFCIAAIELLGSVFAICLACVLKNESGTRYA